ncbi:MAG TPA: F0F1 ATP synthase subunit delta [Oceanipulchritudo sp.]|nr:F0F1 ATP synthase subunit delta [Oceanipulchritudo sp.]
MANPQDLKLAKRLALLVVEAGQAGVAELKPALEMILAGRSAKDRKTFLKAFHKAAVREIHKDTLTIESAQALLPETVGQLVEHFSQDRLRPVHVVEKTNPELIAGMRVRMGDTVYDASLANNLQSLASRIR